MTPEFRLNLIRRQVPTLPQRRARYGAMVAYLAAIGALLAVATGVATSWLMQAARARTELMQIDRGFARTHAARPIIAEHATWIEKEMTVRTAMLRAVDRQLAGRPALGHLLYALASSLPPEVRLRSLTLDASDGAIVFELLVPSLRAEAGLGSSDMITQWNQDAAVSRYLSGIVYVSSQRLSNGEHSDVIWRFSGHLVHKES